MSHDVLNELRRELGCRNVAYPKWVASNRLSKESADKQIALLKQAIDDLGRYYALKQFLDQPDDVIFAMLDTMMGRPRLDL